MLTGLGIAILIVIRLTQLPSRAGRKSRFAGSNAWMAYYVEYTIVGIVIGVLLLRAPRHRALEGEGDVPTASRNWASYPLAKLFEGASVSPLETGIFIVAAAKIILSMAWFIVISANMNMGIAWHRFTGFPNIFFKRDRSGPHRARRRCSRWCPAAS